MIGKLLSLLLVVLLAWGCGRHKETKGEAATLEEFNRAVEAVVMHSGGRFPPDTNEVARFLTLWGKTLPLVPPGKKLAIDPAKQQFVLVDQ